MTAVETLMHVTGRNKIEPNEKHRPFNGAGTSGRTPHISYDLCWCACVDRAILLDGGLLEKRLTLPDSTF